MSLLRINNVAHVKPARVIHSFLQPSFAAGAAYLSSFDTSLALLRLEHNAYIGLPV